MSNAYLVLPPVLVPRQSEYPRAPGPLPYHMQHANHTGMPGNANFPHSFSHHPPGGPGMCFYSQIQVFYLTVQIYAFKNVLL